MTEFGNDPLAGVFHRYLDEIDAEIAPYGTAEVKREVRSRRRRRAVVTAAVVALAVGVPVTASAMTRGSAPAPTRSVAPASSAPVSDRPTPSATPDPSGSSASMQPPSVRSSTSAPSSSAYSTGTASHTLPGTLVYVSRAGKGAGQFHAMVIATGTGPTTRTLVGTPQWSDPPDTGTGGFSADGSRIAFADNVTGGPDVANSDGTGIRHLGGAALATCGSPVWSPDGSRLAYATDGSGGEVVVSAPDGSGRKSLGTGCYPVFSADGTRVAYVDGRGRLVLIHPDGTGRTVVPVALGSSRVRAILSVAGDRAVVDLATGSCCDDASREWGRLADPYLIDLRTGGKTRLPDRYGTVWSAFLADDGGLVLRVAPHGGSRPGKVVFLRADGTVRATFDESVLARPGVPVSLNAVDLVGFRSLP